MYYMSTSSESGIALHCIALCYYSIYCTWRSRMNYDILLRMGFDAQIYIRSKEIAYVRPGTDTLSKLDPNRAELYKLFKNHGSI
jgi:hypothetical protein